jgi:ribonuclease HI
MWQTKDNYLEKIFEFDSFGDAISFINQVAEVANAEDHHPKIIIDYNKVTLQSSTHSAGSVVTEKDHLLADKIDALFGAPEIKAEVLKVREAKLYTDGGSRGNPGPSAIGFVVMDMQDNVLRTESKYLGLTTNNQAEYQGLKEGLEACRKMNIAEVHVHMDSLLVVNQMKGAYKVKNRDLWPIYESIKELVTHFSKVTFTHVPRELNKIADGMVNECLDAQA